MQNSYLDQDDLRHVNRFSEISNIMGRPSSLTRHNIDQQDYNQNNEFYPRGLNEIVPLVEDQRDISSKIKKDFIAAIDNVFGGNQPSRTLMAENMNMISNGMHFQNFDNDQFMPTQFENNGLLDNLNCSKQQSMLQIQQQSTFSNTILDDQPFNAEFGGDMEQEDIFKVPEVPLKLDNKSKSLEEQTNVQQLTKKLSLDLNEATEAIAKKKRSKKAETKQSLKKAIKNETTAVFNPDESITEQSESTLMKNNDSNPVELDLDKLTNKKKEYLQDAIIDKNGAYSYLDDPSEYKKARKRLQNRESAVRSRQRKKNYLEEMEDQIKEREDLIAELKESNIQYAQSNHQLSSENANLKEQLRYFQDSQADSILVGGLDTTIDTKQQEFDQKLADILKKINFRFQQEDSNMDLSMTSSFNGQKSEKRQKLEIDDTSSYELVSENSFKTESGLSKPSNATKGYLRMALVVGMMACSSLTQDSSSLNAASKIANSMDIDMVDGNIEESLLKMNLLSQETKDSQSLKQTAHMMKNFAQQNTKSSLFKEATQQQEGLIQTLASGKYRYLANSMANTATQAFWMTPKQHRMRMIKPKIIQF